MSPTSLKFIYAKSTGNLTQLYKYLQFNVIELFDNWSSRVFLNIFAFGPSKVHPAEVIVELKSS